MRTAETRKLQARKARHFWASMSPEERENRRGISAPKATVEPALSEAQRTANELAQKRAEVEQHIRELTRAKPVTEKSLWPIGYRIRRARAEQMSQLELADACGVDECTIELLERGRFYGMDVALLAAIVVELEVSPGDVLE